MTPLSLGTDQQLLLEQNWFEFFFARPEYEVVNDVIIKRNLPIPAEAMREYKTTYDN